MSINVITCLPHYGFGTAKHFLSYTGLQMASICAPEWIIPSASSIPDLEAIDVEM